MSDKVTAKDSLKDGSSKLHMHYVGNRVASVVRKDAFPPRVPTSQLINLRDHNKGISYTPKR